MFYVRVDMDSFVDAETMIYPELTERYPGVAIILCATKCDVDNEDEMEAAADHEVVSGKGMRNGNLIPSQSTHEY
jgi:hypothetical protein